MSFTTVISALRSVWRRPKRPLVHVPQNSVKLYERTPPAWARWALVLLSVDIMVSTSAVDIIWNTWTMPDPNLQNSAPTGKPAVESSVVTTENDPNTNKLRALQVIPQGHVLVPTWKRALSGSSFVISGIIVAASILAARSRAVRSISYLRTPGVPPSIYVQTAGHPRKFGNSYAVKDCWLVPSNEEQLMLEIKDHGKWVMGMRGAKIANKPLLEDRKLTRSTMLQTWKAVGGATRPLP